MKPADAEDKGAVFGGGDWLRGTASQASSKQHEAEVG